MKAEQQTQDPPYPSGFNLTGLQALRGICAILILIHHFGFQTTATDAFGDISVSIFFILSGFVLTISYAPRAFAGSPPSFFRFIFHRLLSIYPLYIAGMIFMWYFEYRYTITRRIMLSQALLLQSHHTGPEYFLSANSPTWFVSDILFCYLLFIPLLHLLLRPRLFRRFLCILFPLYITIILLLPESSVFHTVYISPLMQLPVFIIGMAIASRFITRPHSSRALLRQKALRLLPLALILLVIQICLSPSIPPRFSLASYWWPVSVLLVYSIALLHIPRVSPASPSSPRSNPIFLFLGDISYPLFIFHYPYLHFSRRMLALNVIPVPPWIELPVALILLVLLSCILSHFSKGVKNMVKDLSHYFSLNR